MNSLKALSVAAALTILPACNDAPKKAPQPTKISQACERYREAIRTELRLDNLRADPNGERRLLEFRDSMAQDHRTQTLATMEALQEAGEDPIECAKQTE